MSTETTNRIAKRNTTPSTGPGLSATLNRLIGFAAIAILISQSVGCSSMNSMLQEPISDYRSHVWANRAYNLRYSDCERRYSEDFKKGFVEGYCDVCDGGDGYVPATAPENYWGYQHQSPEGAGCVNSWFQGYPLGAQAAKKDGGGAFHDVYVSRMMQSAVIQQNANHVLPDDVPVVAPQRPRPEIGPVASPQPRQPFQQPQVQQPLPQSTGSSAHTQLPSIIQSSSFVPRDPNKVVPDWTATGPGY